MSGSARKSLVLLGAGGHAKACIDVIEQHGQYDIYGLIGLPAELGADVLGYPVIGTDADLPSLLGEGRVGIVTLGQIRSPSGRRRLYEALLRQGNCVPAIVSPRAYVSSHARLGRASIVMHGAIVNAGAQVGQNCIINSLALVEHDCDVGDHCHVSTGARLNGGVKVGEGSFIGSGATICQGVTIGANCVIGMGVCLFADCPDGTVVSVRKETK